MSTLVSSFKTIFDALNYLYVALGDILHLKLSLKWSLLNLFFPSSAVHDTKGASKSFPKHETRHVSEHKVMHHWRKIYPVSVFLFYLLSNIFLEDLLLSILIKFVGMYSRMLPDVQNLVLTGRFSQLGVQTRQLSSLRWWYHLVVWRSVCLNWILFLTGQPLFSYEDSKNKANDASRCKGGSCATCHTDILWSSTGKLYY